MFSQCLGEAASDISRSLVVAGGLNKLPPASFARVLILVTEPEPTQSNHLLKAPPPNPTGIWGCKLSDQSTALEASSTYGENTMSGIAIVLPSARNVTQHISFDSHINLAINPFLC